jgi:molybdenum cofactor cytidylyltransferase
VLEAVTAAVLPTVLILASGRGARFLAAGGGLHKLQADLCGMTVLERTLETVRASGLPLHIEDAGHPGMGDTIAEAVRATPHANGWLVLPADLPFIAPQTLLMLAHAQSDADVLVPDYQGQRGHPVRFARCCGDALTSLHGNQGAAAVVAAFKSARWPVEDAGCVMDIDTPADLERARAWFVGRNGT